MNISVRVSDIDQALQVSGSLSDVATVKAKLVSADCWVDAHRVHGNITGTHNSIPVQ